MSTPDTWFDATVIGIRNLTPTVKEFRLQYPLALRLAPGAHIDVQVAIDGQTAMRSYSVVRSDANGQIVIAVKQVQGSRGGSRYMASLTLGSTLKASAPVSNFEPVYGPHHYLLLAAGIGVTPMLSVARALVAQGASVQMLYAVRNKDEQAYLQDLQDLLGERLRVFSADRNERLDVAAEINALAESAQLYLCGPIKLLDAAREHWQAAGRPAAQLRYETFGSSGRYLPQDFTVRVPRLGREVLVDAGQSMLDALSEAGIAMVSNCRRGECGLCAVDVLETDGVLDHRDVFFSSREHAGGNRICTCVSRVAGTSITIEPPWRGDPDLSHTTVL